MIYDNFDAHVVDHVRYYFGVIFLNLEDFRVALLGHECGDIWARLPEKEG
jgi:hypothetical protein